MRGTERPFSCNRISNYALRITLNFIFAVSGQLCVVLFDTHFIRTIAFLMANRNVSIGTRLLPNDRIWALTIKYLSPRSDSLSRIIIKSRGGVKYELQ